MPKDGSFKLKFTNFGTIFKKSVFLVDTQTVPKTSKTRKDEKNRKPREKNVKAQEKETKLSRNKSTFIRHRAGDTFFIFTISHNLRDIINDTMRRRFQIKLSCRLILELYLPYKPK